MHATKKSEDTKDRSAVRASLARAEKGIDDAIPADLFRRVLVGEHPVKVWREYRGFGLNALAKEAKLSASYLSEIEKRVKPGSVSAMRSLAKVLDVTLDDLVN